MCKYQTDITTFDIISEDSSRFWVVEVDDCKMSFAWFRYGLVCGRFKGNVKKVHKSKLMSYRWLVATITEGTSR